MYKLPQEYLSVDPAGIILKNCCESLITEQGSFTLFVCIKIEPSGGEVFVPCFLKCKCFCLKAHLSRRLKSLPEPFKASLYEERRGGGGGGKS